MTEYEDFGRQIMSRKIHVGFLDSAARFIFVFTSIIIILDYHDDYSVSQSGSLRHKVR